MQFYMPVSDLESLLQTEYHVYEHVDTGKTTVACDKYHVPADVQQHIDYIIPGIKLLTEKRRLNSKTNVEKHTFGATSRKGDSDLLPPLLKSLGLTLDALLAIPELEVCDIAITPVCIKALYNVTAGTKAASGNQLGIFEDLGDVYSQTDLNEFFTFARYKSANSFHLSLI
jgi:tripeptidyl-peptidase-1